jgi:Fur family ferric uptake transcriptional regulator
MTKKVREQRELFHTYLRQNGLKRTHQKDLILETFLATEGHLSVEDLYAQVRKRDRKVGIVTVFRTLKTLTACGIAREISLGDGLTRFEHSYHHPHHHHIICTECRKAIEFASPELERIQDAIVHRYNFQPLRHRLQIYGVCADCREHRPVPEPVRHDTEMIFARDALQMALRMERQGIDFYRDAAARDVDPEGRAVFECIAEEEAAHIGELEAELAGVLQHEKGLADAPIFLHFDADELERLVPDLDPYVSAGELRLGAREAFEVALTFERRAAEFFTAYADKFMETEGRKILETFAHEEQKHYQAIRRRAEALLQPAGK